MGILGAATVGGSGRPSLPTMMRRHDVDLSGDFVHRLVSTFDEHALSAFARGGVAAAYGVNGGGAVRLRPDGQVARRSAAAPVTGEIENAFQQVLARNQFRDCHMASIDFTLAAIGCSGPVTESFVTGFLSRGVKVRILARNPAALASRYPGAERVEGSMMNAAESVILPETEQ